MKNITDLKKGGMSKDFKLHAYNFSDFIRDSPSESFLFNDPLFTDITLFTYLINNLMYRMKSLGDFLMNNERNGSTVSRTSMQSVI